MMKDVTFWRPQWAFIVNLINQVLEEDNTLSEKQEKWLRHYFYRYRDQIRDNIIYEKVGDEELYEQYDDIRVAVEGAIAECEQYKDIDEEKP